MLKKTQCNSEVSVRMADAHQVDISSLRYSLALSEQSVFNFGVGNVGLVVALILNAVVTGCTIWNVLFAACSTDTACLGWVALIWSVVALIFNAVVTGCTVWNVLRAHLLCSKVSLQRADAHKVEINSLRYNF